MNQSSGDMPKGITQYAGSSPPLLGSSKRHTLILDTLEGAAGMSKESKI
jgi:hypothetical protein